VSIRFGPFLLDPGTRQLTRAGRGIHLTSKAFELLLGLVEARPNVLSKAALQEHLWPDTFVAEANLSNLVAEIRHALGDSARLPLFVRTVHGRGYAFCGEATVRPAADPGAGGRARCWLEWGRQRFPLTAGAYVIGRDPDVDVRLDASTVSRRHAQLLVTAEQATLEDFGSKNGTFHGDERVTSPIRLADGDAIRIGSLLITFHAHPGSMSTDTQVRSTL
jgi:DNA-binding winged helix-turn-helix (wHTH) protein